MTLTEKEIEVLYKCYILYKGSGWEPKGGTNTKVIRKFIDEGFLRTVDGCCGFERFKDTFVVWTEAGKLAMEYLKNQRM